MIETPDELLTARDKGIPQRAIGMTTSGFLASSPRLDEFWTPLLVLDDAAMRHNVDAVAAWCADRGLHIMPHGKTTMAPALWRRQMEAGALGITLATLGQVRTARDLGVPSIMLANAAVDERSLAYLAGELADPDFRFVCWVDSLDTVAAMERGLQGLRPPRPVDVCVELGAPGGRTGARTVDEAARVGEAVAGSSYLRLAGVAGYEGCLAHDRTPESLAVVRTYLERMVALHGRLAGLYGDGETYVTAGGSAYQDVVADVFVSAAGTGDATRWVLRSGAYIVHDDGFYRGISPFDPSRAAGRETTLLTAMHGYGRVVSQPEPGLALLDGGKRDFPYDEGLPIPRGIADDLGAVVAPWAGAEITALNDQHCFLRWDAATPAPVRVGSVVELGLSHPCTAFDKWRVIPVVDSLASGRVIDLVRTYF